VNLITALIIVGIMYLSVFVMGVWVVWWMFRNNIMVQVSEMDEGVFMSYGGRHRIIKGQLFAMRDIWKRHPLKLIYKEVEKYIMVTESIPIVGVKRTLKLTKDVDGNLIAWKPNIEIKNVDLIKPTLVAWVDKARTDLFETTKQDMTRKEMISKIIVPLSLVILAVCCIIFFPKMYAAVMAGGNAAVNSAFEKFSNLLSEYVPLG